MHLYKIEPKQKYLVDQSDSSEFDESEDDVSDSGDEDEYSISMTYDSYNPDMADPETQTQLLELVGQLEYAFVTP